MNIESNRRIEVARSEEEMYEKLELLQAQGYEERDIHLISTENAHLYSLNRHSDVSTHEAGTFVDKFKSWFTGENAISESLRKLDLDTHETELISNGIVNGSIVLFTDVVTHADDVSYGTTQYESEYTDTVGTDVVQSRFKATEEPVNDFSKKERFTPRTDKFVNETSKRFDEPIDRFTRAESFATDPYLAKSEKHNGHTMEEEKMIRERRPTNMEVVQNDNQRSPTLEDEKEGVTLEQYEERLEREKRREQVPPMNRLH
ncbi:general stress protein [Psychrobacillus vulpis]|uniref:General stress protein 17M-like domain-containing protein n=1 Tax=Psychrobacillus vulpis TaxID=2325572 RepID=A0A544TSD5_9BACI|nr:general stress protein [Psychrobacillus vulpis]TQR20361.1 hypothetical protein FG384_07930 [Psychrobacillus vulpis]